MVQIRCDGVVESGRPMEGKMQCQASEVVALERFTGYPESLLEIERRLVGWKFFVQRRALCPVCAGRSERPWSQKGDV